MSEYLSATIILIIFASVFSIWSRAKDRKEVKRKNEGVLTADDFKIVEI